MARRWIVYSLSDPETGAIRYVGITHQRIETRMAGHRYGAKRNNTHCAAWIRSLASRGLDFRYSILESGEGDGWQSAEQRWIAHHRDIGCDLVNHTIGGEGTIGWKPSEAWLRKNAERRKLIGEQLRGRTFSPEARARMKAAQQRKAAEDRANGIKRKAPTLAEDHYDKLAELNRGKKFSEERRISMSEHRRDPNSSYQSESTKQKHRENVKKRPDDWWEFFAKNQKGKPKSEETRRKMSEAAKRRGPKSEETKQKLREHMLNNPLSDEEKRRRLEKGKETKKRNKELRNGQE